MEEGGAGENSNCVSIKAEAARLQPELVHSFMILSAATVGRISVCEHVKRVRGLISDLPPPASVSLSSGISFTLTAHFQQQELYPGV